MKTTIHPDTIPGVAWGMTISRIIDSFPGHQHNQIRAQLSFVLQAICAQQLLPKFGGGRVLATELLIPNPAIRNLIREAKVAQMYSAIQTGQSAGMQTLDQNLKQLVAHNIVTIAEARSKAANKDNFRA